MKKLLQEMAVVGIIEYNWENPQTIRSSTYCRCIVPGSAEFMVMNKEQVEEHTEIADFFEQMARLPLEKVTPMVPLGGAGIGMHVIPVEKAIPADTGVCSVEHISHWLKKYKDKYAVGAVFLPSAAESPRRGNRRYRGRVVHRCRRYGRLPVYRPEEGRYVEL